MRGCSRLGAWVLQRRWQSETGRRALAARLRQAQTTTGREREEGALGARTSHRLMARALESECAAGASWCAADTRQICAVCDGGRRVACRAVGDGGGGPCRRQGRGRLACSRWHGEQQRNATQRSAAQQAGRTIRREAGQRSRAARLPGESRGARVGSGCELTPSQVLG